MGRLFLSCGSSGDAVREVLVEVSEAIGIIEDAKAALDQHTHHP